jgi:ribosomal protein S18 acetylase RimI-like enzyme
MSMPRANSFRPSVDLPPIPELAFRHLRVPDDFAAMTEIANASRIGGGASFLTTVDNMANFYSHLVNCDPARDVVTVSVADKLIGYARCAWYDQLVGGRVYELIGFLAPPWRRHRIGRAMLATLEARIAEIVAADPVEPALLEVEVDDGDVGKATLLEQAGYAPARYHFTMVRPDLADHAAAMPTGLEIRDVRPEHLRAIWEAHEDAFADHWGAAISSEAAYKEFRTSPMADPRLWRVAWDGEQVAGQVRSFINAEENRRYGRQRGWVEYISVRRPWRRRGLARALIAASFPVLRARGMTEGALTVDTENLTGARGLYESMGFEPVARDTTYRKALS